LLPPRRHRILLSPIGPFHRGTRAATALVQ
jgi:hypothetical protein